MTKILVIEDEATLRHEVVELLMLEDYDALGAQNGQAGIKQALDYQPDLILCDISMPDLDGYGVLKEIRENPVTTATPFIFMSARAAPDDIQKGLLLGANYYLTKPFYHKDLFHAIKTCLASQ